MAIVDFERKGNSGGGGGGDSEAVKYTAQTLTTAQKSQARQNIGIWTGTAAQYAQLTPSSDTIYIITP